MPHRFKIEQNFEPVTFPIPAALKQQVNANSLLPALKKLTPYRQKEILRYPGHLKPKETLERKKPIAKAIPVTYLSVLPQIILKEPTHCLGNCTFLSAAGKRKAGRFYISQILMKLHCILLSRNGNHK